MRSYICKIFIISFFCILSSCNSFLDVVPDNIATIDYAFRLRSTAEKYLFTCYSFLPEFGSRAQNPALAGADEIWLNPWASGWSDWRIARGEQNVNSPILNYWDDMWRGISQCNIFIENIHSVPDMEEYERLRWESEVKFLKAFYYFYLLKSYGPVPVIEENIPVSASSEDVRVFRQPVDDVFDYIIALIDEATQYLPERVDNLNTEYGRVTLPIALGYKAKILTNAASPLFNGNTDYSNFLTKEGEPFFNQEYQIEKWEKAEEACKIAIDKSHELGHKLFYYEKSSVTENIPDSLITNMNIRGIVTERYNDEILWAIQNSDNNRLQRYSQPRSLAEDQREFYVTFGLMAASMKIADLFYTENGVPIEEDKTWPYDERFELQAPDEGHKYYLKPGDQTVKYHFNREPRFYGSLGFDRGIWFGQGKYDKDDLYWLELKLGEFNGKRSESAYSSTGYYIKKFVNYQSYAYDRSKYSYIEYPWPMLRLGDLYLLHAEVLNEINGPNATSVEYLDRLRERAGIPGVMDAWSQYSNQPSKPDTKDGLRKIIQRERAVEMAFEGQRFWDLRRWKTAPQVLNKPIYGWDVEQEQTEDFYRLRTLFNQTFLLKDYFWPIKEQDLIVNKNLVQNPGW